MNLKSFAKMISLSIPAKLPILEIHTLSKNFWIHYMILIGSYIQKKLSPAHMKFSSISANIPTGSLSVIAVLLIWTMKTFLSMQKITAMQPNISLWHSRAKVFCHAFCCMCSPKDLSGSGIMGSSPVGASVKRSPYAGIFSDVKNTYHSCEIKRLQRNSWSFISVTSTNVLNAVDIWLPTAFLEDICCVENNQLNNI